MTVTYTVCLSWMMMKVSPSGVDGVHSTPKMCLPQPPPSQSRPHYSAPKLLILHFSCSFRQFCQTVTPPVDHSWETYNDFHNILRLFDVLPSFPFTTSETKHDC